MDRGAGAIVKQIAQAIYDKKGMNILALDIKGLSSITDVMLIAEGEAKAHTRAISKAVVKALGERFGLQPLFIEGLKEGEWVVLDYGDVTIHLFKKGFREAYALERLWPESKLIDLSIDKLDA